MNKQLIVVALCVFFLAVVAGGLYYFFSLMNSDSGPGFVRTPEPVPVILPSVPDNTVSGGGAVVGTPQKAMTLATFDKSVVAVRNFIDDRDVVTIGGRTEGKYYSLGSVPLGPHVTVLAGPADSPTSKERGYEILYFPDEPSLSLAILKEPIGEVRRAATSDLAVRLGVSEDVLCSLLISVQVQTPGVFTGKYIGFPGCKDAKVLPGD